MNESLENRVIQVIAKAQNISPDVIGLDQSIESIGQDSLDLVNLLFALEDEFDLNIPEDVKTSKSVRDVVKEIEQALEAKEKAGTEVV